jgi:hypothetical protein
VLISGTAANPPSNIIFDKFKFAARASSGPGQIAVKIRFRFECPADEWDITRPYRWSRVYGERDQQYL